MADTGKAIADFAAAAFPWVLIGLAAAFVIAKGGTAKNSDSKYPPA